MRLYFAGGENKSWLNAMVEAGVSNSLYSYYYLMEGRKHKEADVDAFVANASAVQSHLFIDSGGFSAFSKGVQINLDDYIEFIKRYEDAIDDYANLDVIGDHKASMRNQQYMEDAGMKPIPVFHWGSKLEDLKAMVERYDRIALGGLVPHARKKSRLFRWLDSCFSIIRNNAKVHGFGMSGLPVLLRYPWFSCDSTSWLGGTMRATIVYFENGDLRTVSTKIKKHANHKSIDLTDQADKRWYQRVVHNAREYQKMEQYVTEVWRQRGIEWKD